MRHVTPPTVLVLALFAGSTAAQPLLTGKVASPDEDQMPFLLETLRSGKPAQQQQAFAMLMKYRPLPKDSIAPLTKLVETEKGDAAVLGAALLADIKPSHPVVLPALEKGLSASPAVSTVALSALAKLGPPAKPQLPRVLMLLETGSNEQRSQAVTFIGKIGGSGAAESIEKMIVKAVAAKKPNVHAALALAAIGKEATPAVMRLLEANDRQVDQHIVYTLRQMTPKPPEALRYMLVWSQDKDANLRTVAFEYLAEYKSPTAEVTEALWRGTEEPVAAMRCITALHQRGADKKKLIEALKRYRGYSLIEPALLLLEIDPGEGKKLIQEAAVIELSRQTQSVYFLAAHEKQLLPVLPTVHKQVEEKSVTSRENAMLFLALIAPEHSRPVEAKLVAQLKSTQVETRFAAARALLHAGAKDKAAIARTLGEVVSFPKRSFKIDVLTVLDLIQGMGSDGKAAVPSLRTALNTKERPDVKGRILLTLAEIDASTRPDVLSRAQALYETPEDKVAGAAALVYIDAPNAKEALAFLRESLNLTEGSLPALRLVEVLGPKAKALAPRLERLAEHPLNIYPTQTVVALARVDGNPKAAADRLLRIAEDPAEIDNAVRAMGRLGPAARPALTKLLASAKGRTVLSMSNEALFAVDPAVLRQRTFEGK